MKVIEKDPRVPFKLSEKHDREIWIAAEVADSVKNLRGEAKIVAVHELFDKAIVVLKKLHDKRMAGHLAQWQTTCRFDGCEKQPRQASNKVSSGHKSHRRIFVFCPAHAGVRNMIAKADYQRLKSNSNLRVVS